ncbi:MAG: 2-oxoacid:acceptor oxidoreductase subunit alpha [Nitriliruptoraceae bacterium]
MSSAATEHKTTPISHAVVRFAGDSGDGMQLTGDRFTTQIALAGNDIATLPDFPAEIRAPAGTLGGVSSFQLHFSDEKIHTPGDAPDVLVAMNPAALKKHLAEVKRGGQIIVNTDEFDARNLQKAGYTSDPLEDGTLTDFTVQRVALTEITLGALADYIDRGDLNKKEAERSKNMVALGLVSWMFSRPVGDTERWLAEKFAKNQSLVEANIAALKAGWYYGETTEAFAFTYEVRSAELPAGRYRNITGNQAAAYGLIAAAQRAGLELFFGSYPITPASDILHELAKHRSYGVTTFQAEDEIAAMGSVIGAAFGGTLAATASSGPGIALKTEAMGLGMMTELPMIVIDVQRGGPSTGLPTKTEQSDLLQLMFGRNGESPIPVIAPSSPSDCFNTMIEAARIALTYRTPVAYLSDGYLANSAEPWLIPDVDDLPDLTGCVNFTTEPNGENGEYLPYKRDPETMARAWALPGTSGLEHRIGGLEKDPETGHISYETANHHNQTMMRHERLQGIANSLPPTEVIDPDGDASVLVLGWGSTWGPITAACNQLRKNGRKVAQVHIRHVAPLPNDLIEIMRGYETVILPENNVGQLAMVLRAKSLIDIKSYNQVGGQPFTSTELIAAIETFGFGGPA